MGPELSSSQDKQYTFINGFWGDLGGREHKLKIFECYDHTKLYKVDRVTLATLASAVGFVMVSAHS